ncbi:transcriptional regulator NosR [Marinobacterium aestuariivivens]|uniref:Transcriptional regulator NosR n=1 Tax=Marinobacterium aestuariivivens TaxID=1698799 RepID=A0ABW2A550_9GAMM
MFKKISPLLHYILLLIIVISPSAFAVQGGLLQSPQELIRQVYPDADSIGDKEAVDGDGPLVRTIRQQDRILGYAFETADVVAIPAYSGKPINLLATIDPEGRFRSVHVLEHHEPILLVGIPEQKLFDFADQYKGLGIDDSVRVGRSNDENTVSLDAITGATVTVMVVNESLMRAAVKVGQALGIAELGNQAQQPAATIRKDDFEQADWQTLTGDGSIRRLHLTRREVNQAFAGTKAERGHGGKGPRADETFIDLYYAPLNVPTIGRNLLGESEYHWLMDQLAPGDQAIAVMANGEYSFKGNGYVRGGIFDRTQLLQDGTTISFHDSDHYRLSDVYIEGFPGFREMAIFIVRSAYEFDPGRPWQLELLVRRQVGALDSVFTSFHGEYQTPEKYLERPEPVAGAEAEGEPRPLWISIWYDKVFQIAVLAAGLAVLTLVIFFQDWLARRPKLLLRLRLAFLIYTVVFIGWYALGQLSVVNVFTFTHSLLGDFQWQLFLLDPMLFILWSFVAITLLLWGRGIYCGWLCPFGALQELINEGARKLRIRQFELPFAVHERLWAIKYIVLLLLFGISLESLQQAERFAEVEPFKTAIMLKFQREWGYVLYAGLLLLASVFTRKAFCRYLCPLGAALTIPGRFRMFDWLKRRHECGNPCKLCANECEVQAIHPDGHINGNECHYCLDCQMTYYNHSKCPPLVAREKRRRKGTASQAPTAGRSGARITAVEVE